jgi:hypothetical protein
MMPRINSATITSIKVKPRAPRVVREGLIMGLSEEEGY